MDWHDKIEWISVINIVQSGGHMILDVDPVFDIKYSFVELNESWNAAKCGNIIAQHRIG